ncbi:MAG: T9SS type A sorting domain-containing protein [Sphingobacteriales bacterium]|nr:MAG: T9SS type A sorting domain-containing protein [Sphingobacteriales bacterium]
MGTPSCAHEHSFFLFMIRVILLLLCLSGSAMLARAQSTPDLETTICVGDTATMTISVTDADSLQWYRNGNLLFGANNDTLITTKDGVYYAKAFRGKCFDVSGDIRVFMAYPRANDDYVIVQMGTLSTFDVLANDEPNCAPFDKSTFTIVSPPSIGTLVSSTGGVIVYKPSPTKLGIDKFVYRVKDVDGRVTNDATVSLELQMDCAIVYPNPVDDVLNVTVNNKRIIALKLYDAWGRQLYQTTVDGPQLTINMQAYAQGIYVIKMFEHDGEGCNMRILKK